MSAKLTIVFFILICFEIGILLVVLPWLPFPSWSENYLLFRISEALNWPGLVDVMTSGYVRGAVTGLGLLNLGLGILEIVNFKQTVRALESRYQGESGDSTTVETAPISDNGSSDIAAPR